mgnify:CR=1 FL=1
MRQLLFSFLFLLASCGDPCSCNNLGIDPFDPSPMPNGCTCPVVKVYAPDIGADVAADVTPTKSADTHGMHKVK